MSFNHQDFDLVHCSRDDLFNAYADMTARANQLATEHALLAQQLHEARGILEAVAKMPMERHRDYGDYCPACGGFSGPSDQPSVWMVDHTPDCPVIRTRAFLAKPTPRLRTHYGITEEDEG